jgi:hypothetical protein
MILACVAYARLEKKETQDVLRGAMQAAVMPHMLLFLWKMLQSRTVSSLNEIAYNFDNQF